MLTDKDMVNDALNMAKVDVVDLSKDITECSNESLRRQLLNMRTQCEQSQKDLANMATQKGWYMVSPQAESSDINAVKTFYTTGAGAMATAKGGTFQPDIRAH